MTPQQVQAQIKEVDGLLNKRKAVPAEKKVISLTALFAQQNWPSGRALSDAAQAALGLEDWGSDNRWNHHFQNNKLHLGLYRSQIGFFWALVCEGRELTLKHIGAPADVIAQFGNKK